MRGGGTFFSLFSALFFRVFFLFFRLSLLVSCFSCSLFFSLCFFFAFLPLSFFFSSVLLPLLSSYFFFLLSWPYCGLVVVSFLLSGALSGSFSFFPGPCSACCGPLCPRRCRAHAGSCRGFPWRLSTAVWASSPPRAPPVPLAPGPRVVPRFSRGGRCCWLRRPRLFSAGDATRGKMIGRTIVM